jgi:hypothetical protein
MSKILGVSFEPWETEIMSSLLYQYKKKNVFEVSQLMADTSQFDYNKNFDAKVLKSPIQIFTLKDLHNKWQTQLNQKRLKKRYNHWKKKLRKSRSVEELINSEMVFNHYERYPFYSKLSKNEKLNITLDVLEYCENILNKLEIDIVITINNQNLLKNCLFEICKIKKIKMLTILNSRIDNNLIVREDFGLGISKKEIRNINLFKDNFFIKTKRFINSFNDKENLELYKSFTTIANKELSLGKKKPILSSIKIIKYRIKFLYFFLYYFKNGLAKKKFDLNKYFYLLFNIQCLLRIIRSYFFNIPFAKTELPTNSRYIYWPLHMRPESSELTLGIGLDELTLIKEVSTFIDKKTLIIIKENPNMLEFRRKSFYKELIKIKNIYLIDPLYSSKKLIRNSIGVIGISGTSLMEGMIMNKPSFAIGKPEFQDFLTGYGLKNIKKFIKNCEKKQKVDHQRKILPYINYVFKKGIKLNLGWNLIKNKTSINLTTKKLMTLLKQFI